MTRPKRQIGDYAHPGLGAPTRSVEPLYTAPQPAPDLEGLLQQHHLDSAERRRLCRARDEQRDGRLAALERAAKAEADVAGLVAALEQGFPLLSDEGLDEVEHHCEWVIQRERKRVHSILAAHRKGAQP